MHSFFSPPPEDAVASPLLPKRSLPCTNNNMAFAAAACFVIVSLAAFAALDQSEPYKNDSLASHLGRALIAGLIGAVFAVPVSMAINHCAYKKNTDLKDKDPESATEVTSEDSESRTLDL